MLTQEELSTIPWSQKSTASGNAAKVPQALAGLVSPDATVRERSYWQLDNEVVVQSDLYEAACLVIPFLIRFLSENVAHGRDRICDLLCEIGHGGDTSTVTCRTMDGQVAPLKVGCTGELKQGLDVFLRDTNDPDPLIRDKANELIEPLNSAEDDNDGHSVARPSGDARPDTCAPRG